MARDTLAGMYPGIGAAVRALGLVGCELAFGHGAYVLIRTGRIGAGLSCGAVVLLCAVAEIGLASAQGEIVSRMRQEAVLREDASVPAPAPMPGPAAVAASIDGGPKKTAEILDAQAQARHETQALQERQQAVRERLQVQRLKLAMQRTQLEVAVPGILALLGALAAACTTPLLEILISSLKGPRGCLGWRRRARSRVP